jgi:hypothetical protein
VLRLGDPAAVDAVVPALQARASRYIVRVMEAGSLARAPEVVRAFATQRPHLLWRVPPEGPAPDPDDAGSALVPLAVWSAPLSRFARTAGARASLLTVVEKHRRPGVEPICWHLVTGEAVETRKQVASVVDAYLARPVLSGENFLPTT